VIDTKTEREGDVDDGLRHPVRTLFSTLEKMNVQALIDAVQEPWYNQTLLQVGDVVVRLGVMQGEFHWHKHDEQDEFFFVLDGVFRIELEGRRGGGAASSRSLQRPCRNVAPTSRPGYVALFSCSNERGSSPRATDLAVSLFATVKWHPFVRVDGGWRLAGRGVEDPGLALRAVAPQA
jgi:hypothetical protein